MSSSTVDITPTPRILRILGDIPFDVWQCYAELIDNSLDAISEAELQGVDIPDPQIDITWSSEEVGTVNREIVIEDSGPGMDLLSIEKAAKAGYSSNDPVHNLGLFGMGFNIATARLGEETIILSTKKGDALWTGIKINFTELIQSKSFNAPVITESKEDVNIHGTKIIVRKLKEGVLNEIRTKKSRIKSRLETVYSPILNKKKVSINVGGHGLRAKPYCVWEASRFVKRRDFGNVSAIQEIKIDLGEVLFDKHKNRYLSKEEVYDYEGAGMAKLPANLVQRQRVLKGWIGIQRYCDPDDFGIDFVRNGRKILIQNKELFFTEHLDTGSKILEYPLELGTTLGGRIVGELHADYLLPTYEKNAFDYSDPSWHLTVEAIRGLGPLLPSKRKALGYDGVNHSPLGKLVNSYRRSDPGTKHLAIPNQKAKELRALFLKGDPAYQDDKKWYKIVTESDRGKEEPLPVDSGENSSDNVDNFLPNNTPTSPPQPQNQNPVDDKKSQPKVSPLPQESDAATLRGNSERVESLCGNYQWGETGKFIVEVKRMVNSNPIFKNGSKVPIHLIKDGVECEFYYDESHPVLQEYPLTPKQWLLISLAESFSIRDRIDVGTCLIGLYEKHMQAERINVNLIRERATEILTALVEKLPTIFKGQEETAYDVIHGTGGGEEEFANKIINSDSSKLSLIKKKDASILQYCPERLIPKLFEAAPQVFFDKAVFNQPYVGISLSNESATANVRNNLKLQFLSYLRDIVVIGTETSVGLTKPELVRFAQTIQILENCLIE